MPRSSSIFRGAELIHSWVPTSSGAKGPVGGGGFGAGSGVDGVGTGVAVIAGGCVDADVGAGVEAGA